MTAEATSLVAAPAALSSLRHEAARGEADLREVAGQFEALFTHMLLKNMRAASLSDGLLDGGQTGFYHDLYDQQMASELSAGKGLGLAEVLVRQMGGAGALSAPVAVPAMQQTMAGAPVGRAASNTVESRSAAAEAATPASFVRDILPHAERAAKRLGVDTRLVLAQAALETGWGKRPIRQSDGQESFNYFGIKAGGSWQGDRAMVGTLEFRDGVAAREQAAFRAYGDPAAAFDDYASLLADSPRYRDAVGQGADAEGFAAALQRGGYATDPQYAEKLARVANGQTLKSALRDADRLP